MATGIRPGSISTRAMEDIVNNARIIMKDALDDGSHRIDAWRFIKKLAAKGASQSR